MKKDIDFILDLAANSSEIIQDDELAKYVSQYDDELSEFELDDVFAAAKPDVEKFWQRYNKDKKV